VDTTDELLARTSRAGARIKKRDNQLRRTTHDLRTRVAKCAEIEGGIFRTFVVKRNRRPISLQQICHLNIKLKQR